MKYFVQKVRTRVSAMRESVALTVCLIAFLSFADVVLGSSVGLSTMQDCGALSGTWKNTHSQFAALECSKEIAWEEISFATNGDVSIVISDGDKQMRSRLTGTYKLYNLAGEGYAPRREIRITVNSIHPPITYVLHKVRVGEFSCFASGRNILWAKDANGKDCVFENQGPNRLDKIHCPLEQNATNTNLMATGTKQRGKRGLHGGRLSLDHKSMYAQHLAIIQIMNEGDSSYVPEIIAFTMPDKDPLLQQDAVRALGAVGSPAAVARLVQMLKTPVVSRQYDEDEEAAILRREIVCALKRIGDVSALPALESVASSSAEYKSVREMAQSAVDAIEKTRASK